MTRSVARHPIRVWQDVTFALLMRELKTRFGTYRLGYAWALLDPMLMLAGFCLLFGLRGRGSFGHVEAPVFILSGYLPFLLFKKVTKQVQSAVGANLGLFYYRQVTPFATMSARYLMEGVVFLLVSFLMVLILLWFGFKAMPADPLHVLLYTLELSWFAFGLGILLCVVSKYSAEVGKIVSLLMLPLMFISGVLIPLSVIPQHLHPWLLWNPILHAIELIRTGWIAGFTSPSVSHGYLAGATLVVLTLAMSAYRLNRYRLIAS